MDVDEEEEGDTTQRLKKVFDYGIEVDFDILSANEREVSHLTVAISMAYPDFLTHGMGSTSTQSSPSEVLGELEASIAKLNTEIERMTPNMKAIDRRVFLKISYENFWHAYDSLLRLDNVENKLADTEKEAEKARKDSKNARESFNDVKQRRYGACFFEEI